MTDRLLPNLLEIAIAMAPPEQLRSSPSLERIAKDRNRGLFSNGSNESSPTCASGLWSSPVRCPEAPAEVIDRDLDYMKVVHELNSKDYQMWQRLSSHGIACTENDEYIESTGQIPIDQDIFEMDDL